MPFHTHDDGSITVEFGVGDIGIACGTVVGQPLPDRILLHRGHEGEIGRSNDDAIGKLASEIGTPVMLVFHSTKSLQVLIDVATELLAVMRGVKGPGGEIGVLSS